VYGRHPDVLRALEIAADYLGVRDPDRLATGAGDHPAARGFAIDVTVF
jgi:hypothetical protein